MAEQVSVRDDLLRTVTALRHLSTTYGDPLSYPIKKEHAVDASQTKRTTDVAKLSKAQRFTSGRRLGAEPRTREVSPEPDALASAATSRAVSPSELPPEIARLARKYTRVLHSKPEHKSAATSRRTSVHSLHQQATGNDAQSSLRAPVTHEPRATAQAAIPRTMSAAASVISQASHRYSLSSVAEMAGYPVRHDGALLGVADRDGRVGHPGFESFRAMNVASVLRASDKAIYETAKQLNDNDGNNVGRKAVDFEPTTGSDTEQAPSPSRIIPTPAPDLDATDIANNERADSAKNQNDSGPAGPGGSNVTDSIPAVENSLRRLWHTLLKDSPPSEPTLNPAGVTDDRPEGDTWALVKQVDTFHMANESNLNQASVHLRRLGTMLQVSQRASEVLHKRASQSHSSSSNHTAGASTHVTASGHQRDSPSRLSSDAFAQAHRVNFYQDEDDADIIANHLTSLYLANGVFRSRTLRRA
jgi:hypothetical protein